MTEGSYYYNATYTIVGTYTYFIWANDTSDNRNITSQNSFNVTPSLTWWNSGWLYRKEIRINHTMIDADLTNFPILINITDTDIKNNAQSDGDDIALTDIDGNQLNYEIEYYDNTTGDLICWVNTSVSSTVDTILYMYYGNPSCSSQENKEDVWDSDYLMVQHLNETSGIHIDSTAYGHDGTCHGSLNQNAVGIIDGADSLDGSNDYIDVGTGSIGYSKLTLEIWFKYVDDAACTASWEGLISKDDYKDFVLAIGCSGGNEGKLVFYAENETGSVSGNIITTSSFNDNNWHLATVTINGSFVSVYVDGNYENGAALMGNVKDSNVKTTLGAYSSVKQFLAGGIDEVRISKIARNIDWIKTCYNNQHAPSTFYIFGSVEQNNAPGILAPSPTDGAVDVSLSLANLSFNLTDLQGDPLDYWVETQPDIGSDNAAGVGNGTYNVSVSGLSPGTLYTWYVNVTDGTYWANETFTFTTVTTLGSWLYRKKITIDHTKIDANLSEYPVMIQINNDNDLATHAQIDFKDILFTSDSVNWSTGSYLDRLNHEIEAYNNTFGNLTVWINIPVLSSTENTILYMYYGNPSCSNMENIVEVWDSNYVLVQHLNETSGIHYDSTSYDNDGTCSGGVNQSAIGIIDGADRFDGINDDIDCGGDRSLDITRYNETVLWLKSDYNPVLPFAHFGTSWYNGSNDYHHYYGGPGGVCHATSLDGINWTIDTANNPVLAPSSGFADCVMAWKETSWHMLYRSNEWGDGVEIGLANSTDGLVWTKDPNNPVLNATVGTWDAGGLPSWGIDPWGVIKVGSTYYLWYNTVGASPRKTGLATSTNLVNWTKDVNNPIFEGNRYCTFPFKYNGSYYMLVPHFPGAEWATTPWGHQMELYRDSNPTFYPDDREYLGVVITGGETGDWDQGYLDTPTVLTNDIYRDTYPDENIWMYYTGRSVVPTAAWRTGLAIGVLDDLPLMPEIDELETFSEMTLEASVKFDSLSGSQIFASKANAYQIGLHQGEFFWALKGTSPLDWAFNKIGFSPSADTWYNVVLSYDKEAVSNNVKFYVQGANSYQVNETGSISLSASNFTIGNSETGAIYPFNGSIDEVRISNIARDTGWVSAGYNNQYDTDNFYMIGYETSYHSPIISNELPSGGSSDQPLNPRLTIQVLDNDGDDIDITFRTNASNNWQDIGSNNSVKDGTYSQVPDMMGSYGEMYYWSVNCTDGTYWTNETYSFTTLENKTTVFTDENPSSGNLNVPLTQSTLSITIEDPDGDTFNWSIETSPDIGSNFANNENNGTKTCSISSLTACTTYTWYVNATDRGTGKWNNKTYSFTTEPPWWNNNWPYRKSITIDHDKVDSDLTNFPVLINITDVNLRDDAQNDSDDIVFTEQCGDKLNHEIEYYDNITGELVAWVNVTYLSSTEDTTLYMYYGNPSCSSQENITGVWDYNYTMVQHLNETSGTHNDSTVHQNNGTCYNDVDQDTVGMIDGADSFDGSNDYISIPNSISGDDTHTISFWVKPNAWDKVWMDIGTDSGYSFIQIGSTSLYIGYSPTGAPSYRTYSYAFTLGNWYHITFVKKGSGDNLDAYVNGVLLTSYSGTVGNMNGGSLMYLGKFHTGLNAQGILDEVRILDTTMNSAWIKCCYNNQFSPSTFHNVGVEESKISENEYNISLKNGWNIISAQCYDTIVKTDITVRNNSINRTWNQAVDNGTILGFLYDYNRTTQSYDFSSSLEPGFGYWLWAYYDCDLIFSSSEIGSGHISDLMDDWDIMGVPYNDTIAKTSVNVTNNSVDYTWNQAVSNDILLGFVYGWNSSDQIFELCDNFTPGRGYWMYAYYDCTLKK